MAYYVRKKFEPPEPASRINNSLFQSVIMSETQPQPPESGSTEPQLDALQMIFARLAAVEKGQAEVLARQDSILALLEAPHIETAARKAQVEEQARQLAEGITSGDLGYFSG